MLPEEMLPLTRAVIFGDPGLDNFLDDIEARRAAATPPEHFTTPDGRRVLDHMIVEVLAQVRTLRDRHYA